MNKAQEVINLLNEKSYTNSQHQSIDAIKNSLVQQHHKSTELHKKYADAKDQKAKDAIKAQLKTVKAETDRLNAKLDSIKGK